MYTYFTVNLLDEKQSIQLLLSRWPAIENASTRKMAVLLWGIISGVYPPRKNSCTIGLKIGRIVVLSIGTSQTKNYSFRQIFIKVEGGRIFGLLVQSLIFKHSWLFSGCVEQNFTRYIFNRFFYYYQKVITIFEQSKHFIIIFKKQKLIRLFLNFDTLFSWKKFRAKAEIFSCKSHDKGRRHAISARTFTPGNTCSMQFQGWACHC